MSEPAEGEILPLPIDPHIISQQAQSTIKSLVDAIVELVTNSDDSYRRLEDVGINVAGDISIHVIRQKGGTEPILEVTDHAEGMDWSSLERAITFASPASGFFQGRTVRGLFGRGLKEAIIGLGRGEIRTVRHGQESVVEIFLENRTSHYKVKRKSRPTQDESGTQVTIEILSPKIRCPKFDVLYRQLSNHFALRDILSNPNRHLQLKMHDGDIKTTRPIRFQQPAGDKKLEDNFSIDGLGDVALYVFESKEKLEFSPGDPGSVAGILVKTDGAIVDSRLFGYEAEEAAHYYYGWLECPGIASAIRGGDLGILDPNRSGLDWRHQYCRALDGAVKERLRPLIYEKRRQLESGGDRLVKPEYKKRLSDVCRLLNALAEGELEDLPDSGNKGREINTLILRPEVGYAEPGQPRSFSVYVPERLLVDGSIDRKVEIERVDTRGNVELEPQSELALVPHQRYEGVLTGSFTLMGRSYGDRAYVVARVGPFEDMAEFRVQSPSKKNRTRVSATSRGLFREIKFDLTPDPIQRVSLSGGTLRVFLRFPPISDYLKPGGEGMDTAQGSLMLAELVAEGFCREVARRRLDAGLAPSFAGGEIDAFNSQVNQLMRKHLSVIHQALVH